MGMGWGIYGFINFEVVRASGAIHKELVPRPAPHPFAANAQERRWLGFAVLLIIDR